MKNQTGYKQMLRDRCPKLVSYALKWCKAKEAWIDHVYKSWIWVFSDKKLRLSMTREILGIDKKRRQFIFEDTIDWENLSKEETSKWKNVTSWVSWFQKTVPLIEDEYKISKLGGAELIDLKRNIILNWLSDFFPTTKDDAKVREKKNKFINDLADYLIDCFENLN
jgi:hypothetical protein